MGIRTDEYNYQARKIGQRIAVARKKVGMTQTEFGKELAKRLHRKKPFAMTTISAWEVGRKICNVTVLKEISKMCDVDMLYLLGNSLEQNASESVVADGNSDIPSCKDIDDYNIELFSKNEIRINHIDLYDKKPVYICFSGIHEDAWALVDYQKQRFICNDGIYSFHEWKDKISVYAICPYYKAEQNLEAYTKVHINTLDNYDDVFVQLFTPDAKMQKSMNGWYKVDHEHRILTNTNGYCLLYENIDVTYNAYRFGKD